MLHSARVYHFGQIVYLANSYYLPGYWLGVESAMNYFLLAWAADFVVLLPGTAGSSQHRAARGAGRRIARGRVHP